MTLEPPVAVSWGMDCCEFLTVWGHMPSGETLRKEAVPGVLISPTMHRGGLSTAFSTLTLAPPGDEFGILCHRPQQLPEYLLVPFVEMPVLSKRSCEVLAHSVGTRLWSLATGGLKLCFCVGMMMINVIPNLIEGKWSWDIGKPIRNLLQ